MSIKESRDEWGGFDISSLFKSVSYRIMLKGDLSLSDGEAGEKIATLKRDEEGSLKEYKLKFQRPTFDGSAQIYPVIQKRSEDGWTFHVNDAETAEEERITGTIWNRRGRLTENEKPIIPDKLEEHAGTCIRILAKTDPDKDMPTKEKSDVQFDSEETVMIVLHEDERIVISAINIPTIPEEDIQPDGA